jgi:GNAT superfamily N-acetyltransferase
VALPDLVPTPPFGWMHTSVAPAPDQRVALAATRDEPSIQALLDDAFPNTLARPGLPGVARWWVFRDTSSVTACAADAWSAPGVGLLAGVAVSQQTRGLGQARAVVSAGLEALVSDYGSAALMVETDNTPARRLYESFAMSYRLLRTAMPGAAGR